MSRTNAILISLLGVFIIGFFLIFPRYQNLKETNLKVQEKRTELQYKEEYFSNIRKTSDELKNYEGELSKIDSAFPADPSLPSLFNFLEKTASQNGLILKYIGTFSVNSSEEKPAIKDISINVTVAGSYPAFKNFLVGLEKTARFIEVENVLFSIPAKDEPFSFALKLKAHSY